MQRLLQYGGHFIASIFLFYLIGFNLALLLIQNQWLDMRFDSEFFILISMLVGLWFYFVMLFMNGKQFAIWMNRKFTVIISIVTIITTTLFTIIIKQGITIIPAYMTRKALFLTDTMSLSQMNIGLFIWLLIGSVAIIFVQKNQLSVQINETMNWNQFSHSNRVGIMALFTILMLFFLLYIAQGEFQSLINEAITVMKNADVEGFRDYLLSFGPLAAVISGLLMILQSVIAPLPAFVITFANGLLFGWFFGAILSWSSAMLGAILCFYLAKILGRPVVEKIVSKKGLQWWDQFFAKYGKHSIFIARLVPIVSFDLVSYTAGVTSVSFWQFFWATGLGQLPATILYSYLGQNATDTVKILFFIFTIVIALAVIGMLLRPKFKSFFNR